MPSRIPIRTTTARSPHLESLRGRGELAGGCEAEYTSDWKIWLSTATDIPSDASGELCTSALKRGQHRRKEQSTIYGLDRTSSCAGPEPLPNILSKFLSGERHAMHAERAEWRRRVEEPCQDLYIHRIICRVHRMGRAPPVYERSST